MTQAEAELLVRAAYHQQRWKHNAKINNPDFQCPHCAPMPRWHDLTQEERDARMRAHFGVY